MGLEGEDPGNRVPPRQSAIQTTHMPKTLHTPVSTVPQGYLVLRIFCECALLIVYIVRRVER